MSLINKVYVSPKVTKAFMDRLQTDAMRWLLEGASIKFATLDSPVDPVACFVQFQTPPGDPAKVKPRWSFHAVIYLSGIHKPVCILRETVGFHNPPLEKYRVIKDVHTATVALSPEFGRIKANLVVSELSSSALKAAEDLGLKVW